MQRKTKAKSLLSTLTDVKARGEARKAFYFLTLALSSMLLLFLVTSLLPLEWFELFTANTLANAYNALGTQARVIAGEPVRISLDGTGIEISYLCTGLLEAIVLASVIIASAGIPINKRIIGVCTGIAFTVTVNLARIFTTLHFIASADMKTADFMHNVFFRLTLFVSIFVFYALWFLWATGKSESRNEKKKQTGKTKKQKEGKRKGKKARRKKGD